VTLTVEQEELLARADELEAPIPGLPSENPQPPCQLSPATSAATQLAFSADSMRTYLAAGDQVRQQLADSLRKAAKAYDDVDENAAGVLGGGNGSVSKDTAGLGDGHPDAVPLGATQLADLGNAGNYADVKQRAWEIEQGDQGASFDRFVEGWTAYQQALLDATQRFRPFQQWSGAAADAVEQSFEQQRQWMYTMADMCGKMAAQAQDVTATHRWAVPEHILPKKKVYRSGDGTASVEIDTFEAGGPPVTYSGILQLEAAYQSTGDPKLQHVYMKIYTEFQATSDSVVAEYVQKAGVPLAPMDPPVPPAAGSIPPPDGPGSGDSGSGDGGTSINPPPGGLDQPSSIPNIPMIPNMPTGQTPSPAALTNAMPGAPKLPTGPAVKPASLGGGAGGGMPAVPLQPAPDLESASRTTPAGRDLASLMDASMGRANLAAGGATGGGMGTAPMGGPGGQPQGDGKGKRVQQGDESLYTEDRPWTEAVIGRHRRKDV
jgi:ESX-1 secreted protein B PE domain